MWGASWLTTTRLYASISLLSAPLDTHIDIDDVAGQILISGPSVSGHGGRHDDTGSLSEGPFAFAFASAFVPRLPVSHADSDDPFALSSSPRLLPSSQPASPALPPHSFRHVDAQSPGTLGPNRPPASKQASPIPAFLYTAGHAKTIRSDCACWHWPRKICLFRAQTSCSTCLCLRRRPLSPQQHPRLCSHNQSSSHGTRSTLTVVPRRKWIWILTSARLWLPCTRCVYRPCLRRPVASSA